MLRVGRPENIFILFLMAIKTAGSAQKVRVGRVSGNTAIFCLRLRQSCDFDEFCMAILLTNITQTPCECRSKFGPSSQNIANISRQCPAKFARHSYDGHEMRWQIFTT